MTHLILLHEKGSTNPTNATFNSDKVKFNPLFLIKDSLPLILLALIIIALSSLAPNILGDVENFNEANPLIAPIHIQPEWYFLFAYVVLRSIPSKLGGVIALGASILILAILIVSKTFPTKFNPTKKIKFWLFISVIAILT